MKETTKESLETKTKEYANNKLNELSKAYTININVEQKIWYGIIDEYLNEPQNKKNESQYYDFTLDIIFNAIDEWYCRYKARYDEYNKKYPDNETNENVIDFKILMLEVISLIPDKYRNEPIKIHYFEQPFNKYELNFDCYKNDGQLLPSYYAYIDKKTHTEYNFTKGEKYILKILDIINQHKDYENIAPLFIFTVLHDFGKIVINDTIDRETIKHITEQAKDYMIRNGYDAPDYRYKRFIVSRYSEKAIKYLNNIDINTIKTEKDVAKFIVTLIDLMLEPYDLEYYTYPKEEYQKALSIYTNAREMYFKDMMECANIINQ